MHSIPRLQCYDSICHKPSAANLLTKRVLESEHYLGFRAGNCGHCVREKRVGIQRFNATKDISQNESDKKLSIWERQGWSSIDKGRERGDVLAPPEKDNLIPNEKDPTMIRCIYLILLSSG